MTSALLALWFAAANLVTLSDALATAERSQPLLRQARASTEVARARANETRAPLLPQLFGSASYSRATANAAPGAFIGTGGGTGTGTGTTPAASWDTYNRWSFSITAQQTLWDASGQLARWRQGIALAEGAEANERTTRLATDLNVRTYFFAARASKALVAVARATLANQERHLQQIDGFVRVGTRPEIDLAQVRTDRANAEVQLINAENGYAVAKAQLNGAMGVERTTEYDVADEELAPLDAEDRGIEALLDEALRHRPELAGLEQQIHAQELAIWAARTGFGPSLTASTGFTDSGLALDQLGWNWSFNLTLNWQLFSGGLTYYAVREQKAALDGLYAQRDLIRQQTRLEVDQAQLGLRAAKAAVAAAGEALANAAQRLRLAEGRYQAGIGSIIELGDAQLAETSAAAQKVQADYNVSTARAQLMKAIGRRG